MRLKKNYLKDRGHLALNKTGTQSFITLQCYSLAQELWVLSLSFYWCIQIPNDNTQNSTFCS